MKAGAKDALAALEGGLLGGLLLGTCAATLLAARNGFAPLQAPLTFALVFWKWLCLAGLAAALPAALVGFVASRVTGRPWALRAALALPVALFFALIVAYNLKAVAALVEQSGPGRYRVLLPVAAGLAGLGLVALVLLPERRRLVPRLLTALAVASAAGAFYREPARTAGAVQAATRPAIRASGERVLVIGIDGGDWELLEPLMARGDLPNLSALRRSGVWTRLRSFEPTRSPIIWTTIATGKPPEEHGINGFTHTRLRGVSGTLPPFRPLKGMGFSRLYAQLQKWGEIYEAPVTSSVRKVPAFWNIASAQGSPIAVVNWWATWPAETAVGHIVSERTYYSILDGDLDADEEHLTYPDALYAEVAHLLMRPEEMTYEVAQRFIDVTPAEYERLRKMPQSGRKDVESGLTYFYSMHESTRRLALHLMEKGRKQYGAPHDMLVLFRLVDMACHTSIHHSELVDEHGGSTPDQLKRYGRVVSEAYRQVDRAVGDLVAAFGGGNVVIVSDHGWELETGGTWSHRKAPDGILIAAGPALRSGRIEGVTVRDILPLLVRLKGFPIAGDLVGHVPEQAFDPAFLARAPVTAVASYGRREDMDLAVGSTAVDEDMVERLRALGYVQ